MPIQLPPSIQGKVRDRHSSHNRNRVRMELSVAQAEWVLSLMSESLVSMDIDHPEFHTAYNVHRSVSEQLDRAKRILTT